MSEPRFWFPLPSRGRVGARGDSSKVMLHGFANLNMPLHNISPSPRPSPARGEGERVRSARRVSVVAVALAAMFFSGCVNWSKDVGNYRAELDKSLPTTKPVFAEDQPVSLVGALRKANDDNETIASSGEDYIQALAEKMRQAGVFLPTLTLGPSYTLSHTNGSSSSIVIPGTGGSGGTVVQTGKGGGTSHSTSVTANASVNGSLSDISNTKSSARTVEQRRQLLLDVRETILLQVAQAYYDVLRGETGRGIAEQHRAATGAGARSGSAREARQRSAARSGEQPV